MKLSAFFDVAAATAAYGLYALADARKYPDAAEVEAARRAYNATMCRLVYGRAAQPLRRPAGQLVLDLAA